MRIIYPFLLCFLLVACSSQPEKARAKTQENRNSSEAHGGAPQTTGVLAGAPFVLEGCYEMTMKRDTARLFLQVRDTAISGKLLYDWHERDGNTGTIRGVLRDSLIVADYTFESEGLTSVREVVFKIKDNTLLQGFGDLDERNGKIIFRNPDQIQFMQEHPFVKVTCP